MINQIKDRAVGYLAGKNPNAAFDPAMIFVIIEVIMELLGSFENCGQSPEEAAAISKNPSRLQVRVVKRITRREMGRRAYRANGRDVVESILYAGKGTSAEEIREAYRED